MAKKKPQPLTATEIAFAKDVNRWIGSRKTYALPSDRAGCEFTTKNLGDQCDQYLHLHSGRAAIGSKAYGRDELVMLLRRYRALRASKTKILRNKRKLKFLAKRLALISDNLFKAPAREKRLAAKERERDIASRQSTFAF